MNGLPVWAQVLMTVLRPFETFALAVLLWLGKLAFSDRKVIIARLDEINGSVKKHTWWIEGHEKHTNEQNERMSGIEQRERERWDGTDRRRGR